MKRPLVKICVDNFFSLFFHWVRFPSSRVLLSSTGSFSFFHWVLIFFLPLGSFSFFHRLFFSIGFIVLSSIEFLSEIFWATKLWKRIYTDLDWVRPLLISTTLVWELLWYCKTYFKKWLLRLKKLGSTCCKLRSLHCSTKFANCLQLFLTDRSRRLKLIIEILEILEVW